MGSITTETLDVQISHIEAHDARPERLSAMFQQQKSETGKPPHPALRVLAIVLGPFVAAEMALALGLESLPKPIGPKIASVLLVYLDLRDFAISNWWWLVPLAALVLVATLLVIRRCLVWRNKIVARVAGTDLSAEEESGFPKERFDLRSELSRTPKGSYFIGLDPKRRPVYLTEEELDSHGHIMGHTGSGKTRSVLEPLMFQDIGAGKGLVFMDAKGSAENVAMMKALAAIKSRRGDLRVFSLAHPKWSHTYNPVYLTPGSDPLATAERVFSVFPLENEYYRGQAKLFFYNLIRALASIEDTPPFNLVDVRLCVADDEILEYVLDKCRDQAAKYEIRKQLHQLGNKRLETFTGLYNALADYDHPLLNSYNPDIVIEDVMNERQITYFNLPANRFALLAPAIGKIVLQHIKAVGSMRQIERSKYDQHPFAVCVDELNRFAFPELVPSLAMLRDARVQFRLAHQSLGDLEQVSDVFARQVQDNTRWKIHLFENDADHLEKVSRAYGTRTTFKKTVRYSLGPLFTFLNTGDVSNREVEEFILHPNKLKSLAGRGQGYLLMPNRMTGVNLEMLPRFEVPAYELPTSLPREGLGLHELFVASAEDKADPKPDAPQDGDRRNDHV